MNLLTPSIEYASRSAKVRIIPLSDIHLGNEKCDEKLLRATVADIAADPLAYVFLLGDMGEWINRKDKRFDPARMPKWLHGAGDIAKRQRERLIELLLPLKGKILAVVEGNHERTIYQHTERDVYSTVAEALRVGDESLLLGPCGFVRVSFDRHGDGGKWVAIFFLTHGWWGGRLMGAGGLNLERIAGWVEADVVLAGHDHKRRAFSVSKLRSTRYGVRAVDVYCCSCGSFLQGADYAQRKGYRPQPVGPLEVLITPDKREIRILQ